MFNRVINQNQNQDQSIYWPTFRRFYGQILFFFILIIKVCNVWNMCSQPPNWNLKEPWSKLIFYQASSKAKQAQSKWGLIFSKVAFGLFVGSKLFTDKFKHYSFVKSWNNFTLVTLVHYSRASFYSIIVSQKNIA